ncbi:hypothetical protein SAMN04487818_110123 [Actinokineospora terrae]|uniref:Uncharacterized protein n=1 Tax=Actinokineospora terrae TaxID=155974 RepID=A0A1H9WEQ5_9PSEU|nr:hypothetical protein SAMN04487818_110123 [Actinokineospora terrae]
MLVAVGALAEFAGLRDVVHAVEADPDVVLRWSAVGGAPAVERVLRIAGVPTVAWSRADGFDLVLACHTTGEVPGLVVSITDSHDIPVAVGVSTEQDRAAAEASIPGAAGRTFVMGDPTWARVLAAAGRRAEFRARLGVPDGVALVALGCARPDAISLVLSRLPFDEFRVATVVPDSAGSPGLIAVSPESDWIAVLIAADVVIGDPGPAVRYARGLGRATLTPDVIDGDLLAAVRANESTVEPITAPASPRLVRDKVRELVDLEAVSATAASRPFGPLDPATVPATAFLMSARESSDVVTVTRVPHLPDRRAGEDVLAVDAAEPDPGLRANAEIIVHPAADDPAAWVAETIATSHCALAVAAGDRAHFTWYTGQTWTADVPGLALMAVAGAVYHHVVDNDAITKPIDVRVGEITERITFGAG